MPAAFKQNQMKDSRDAARHQAHIAVGWSPNTTWPCPVAPHTSRNLAREPPGRPDPAPPDCSRLRGGASGSPPPTRPFREGPASRRDRPRGELASRRWRHTERKAPAPWEVAPGPRGAAPAAARPPWTPRLLLGPAGIVPASGQVFPLPAEPPRTLHLCGAARTSQTSVELSVCLAASSAGRWQHCARPRSETAKESWKEIHKLVEELMKRFTNPNLKISIVTYSSQSYTQRKLTTDRQVPH
ncbi:basic proline-rich protein-like [Ursus maritimus]|uniref:Basic proline-rich protein-like n=1 Tax=Ursus maritimus TaxID=29073 RepID=A0A8M1F8F1_URSMA|nr:basic proline-rich protein-like [Ursus maritimus]